MPAPSIEEIVERHSQLGSTTPNPDDIYPITYIGGWIEIREGQFVPSERTLPPAWRYVLPGIASPIERIPVVNVPGYTTDAALRASIEAARAAAAAGNYNPWTQVQAAIEAAATVGNFAGISPTIVPRIIPPIVPIIPTLSNAIPIINRFNPTYNPYGVVIETEAERLASMNGLPLRRIPQGYNIIGWAQGMQGSTYHFFPPRFVLRTIPPTEPGQEEVRAPQLTGLDPKHSLCKRSFNMTPFRETRPTILTVCKVCLRQVFILMQTGIHCCNEHPSNPNSAILSPDTFVPTRPVINNILPNMGGLAGGGTVFIYGTGFLDDVANVSTKTRIFFGDREAQFVAYVSPIQVNASPPPGSNGLFINPTNGQGIQVPIPVTAVNYASGSLPHGVPSLPNPRYLRDITTFTNGVPSYRLPDLGSWWLYN